MAKDWSTLGGERGKKVDTNRVRRALKLGGLATRVTGSFIKRKLHGLRNQEPQELDSIASAAVANARQFVDVMGEMKGAAMKIGQILSADPEMIDPSFAEKLSSLQNKAPPMDFVSLSRQVEKNLDLPMSSVFRYFDPEPLGSASIGQVHRATLFDDREVAVKVQYPGIAASLESDLKNFGGLLKMGRAIVSRERADELLDEARDAILAEADYRIETQNLLHFRSLLSQWEDIRIPEPIEDLCTKEVLVMEFIEGVPLHEGVNAIANPEVRNGLAERFAELFVHLFHVCHELHADPHPGNFLLASDGRIALLDFGCVRRFDPETTDGILQMVKAFFDDDMAALGDLLSLHRFGRPGMVMPPEDVLRTYHRIILEPLLEDRPFRFSEFAVHSRAREFVKEHLVFITMIPPAELLLYFRTAAGLKAMLTRMDAEVNIHALARRYCAIRGIE